MCYLRLYKEVLINANKRQASSCDCALFATSVSPAWLIGWICAASLPSTSKAPWGWPIQKLNCLYMANENLCPERSGIMTTSTVLLITVQTVVPGRCYSDWHQHTKRSFRLHAQNASDSSSNLEGIYFNSVINVSLWCHTWVSLKRLSKWFNKGFKAPATVEASPVGC